MEDRDTTAGLDIVFISAPLTVYEVARASYAGEALPPMMLYVRVGMILTNMRCTPQLHRVRGQRRYIEGSRRRRNYTCLPETGMGRTESTDMEDAAGSCVPCVPLPRKPWPIDCDSCWSAHGTGWGGNEQEVCWQKRGGPREEERGSVGLEERWTVERLERVRVTHGAQTHVRPLLRCRTPLGRDNPCGGRTAAQSE